MKTQKFIRRFASLTIKDVGEVGGKNASLGEMIRALGPKGVSIPDGFATTARAFRHFLRKSKVSTPGGTGTKEKNLEQFIAQTLKGLGTTNIRDLQRRGKIIREAIVSARLPKDFEREIRVAYRGLEKKYGTHVDVAVRSSATAEDLPGASFAGQQETYLHIVGEEKLLSAVRRCFASLFTDRAISYRHDKGFDHTEIALSVGVQKMVRSDKACSGVLFTLDTESGFGDVVLINGSWGLGEMIVQGEVIPDEFLAFRPFLKDGHGIVPIINKKLGAKERMMVYSSAGAKPTKIIPVPDLLRHAFILEDEEILKLARWGVLIEEHYTRKNRRWTPMDLEWAKDGRTGELFVVQARPETVHAQRDFSKVQEYKLHDKGKPLVSGASVGSKIAVGRARVILDVKGIHAFEKGEVLVTDMTDPDWEPIMKVASAIVTDKGGRTSHAAIVSRELGIPCIVGSGNATRRIKTGQTVTVDTTGSEGYVYRGALKFSVTEHNIKKLPHIATKIMMNIATPETAFEKSFLPNSGVGLAREEFIIASEIGIHPMALVDWRRLKAESRKSKAVKRVLQGIEKRTIGYKNKTQFYVDKLAYGVAMIGAAFYPKPVIVRFSDFKTNEYRQLVGGELYEPQEENPMIGWRGASRYYNPAFERAFALEVEAIKKVREQMGLSNIQVMIPFCRTVEEGKRVLALMKKYGLERESSFASSFAKASAGREATEDNVNLKVYVMCEIPSNVILADRFLDIFDGMSIGSNDLTQLALGIDRDGNERIRSIANENNAAVRQLLAQVIHVCRKRKKYVGICGQGPSDFPDLAAFLVREGIESMSLNPDSVISTILALSRLKKARRARRA